MTDPCRGLRETCRPALSRAKVGHKISLACRTTRLTNLCNLINRRCLAQLKSSTKEIILQMQK